MFKTRSITELTPLERLAMAVAYLEGEDSTYKIASYFRIQQPEVRRIALPILRAAGAGDTRRRSDVRADVGVPGDLI